HLNSPSGRDLSDDHAAAFDLDDTDLTAHVDVLSLGDDVDLRVTDPYDPGWAERRQRPSPPIEQLGVGGDRAPALLRALVHERAAHARLREDEEGAAHRGHGDEAREDATRRPERGERAH